MKILGLSGSRVGATTRTAMDHAMAALGALDPTIETELLDLAELDIAFADGRGPLEHTGDTLRLVQALLDADAVLLGTPVFQASIPGALKNVLDLLPPAAFRDTVVGMLVTAGSPRHYLVAEQHLRPVLTYMKAQLVQDYVFVESRAVHRGRVVDDDAAMRIDRLVEDLVLLTRATQRMREERDAAYAF